MAKISIIVPIYNVENYIRKCVDSILAQSFSDFELLLIDDGSTDCSGTICDMYAHIDARVKVIHKENGGLSDARNTGIEAATGEYIGFVDGDDYILPNMYETLYKGIGESNADIATCGVKDIYQNTEKSHRLENEVWQFEKKEIMVNWITGQRILISICCKLVKASIMKEVRFKRGKTYEDCFMAADLMLRVNHMWATNSSLYCYVHRTASITTRPYQEDKDNMLEATEYMYGVISEEYPDLKEELEFRRLFGYFATLDRMLFVKHFKELNQYKEVLAVLRSNSRRILCNPYFQKTRKIGIVFLKANVYLYKMLVYIKKRKEILK